jgi:2-oxoisovalerate dehydrogenase E1 component
LKITENFKRNKILTEEFDESLRTEIKSVIDESLAIAMLNPEIETSLSEELNIYKPYVFEEFTATEGKKNTFIDAISTV